jgi:uncharacterized protein YidB (DUF937 family)
MMSWLKAIAGGMIGAEALNLIKSYVDQQGGLDGVVKKFEQTGFGREVKSWISTDPNKPLNEIEIGQAIGIDNIKKIALENGIDLDKARDLLAQYLPIAIDKATPDGKLPPKDEV